MAYVAQGAEIRYSAPAAADLSAKQFYFVKWNGSGAFAVCAAATDVPVGVLQNKPTAGQQAEVVAFGPSKVNCDAALAQGDLIGTSADGQADKKIPGTDTTEYAVGRVMEASGAAGDIIQAFINCVNPHRAA